MQRRTFLKAVAAGTAGTLAGCRPEEAEDRRGPRAGKRPNVVFILTDDQRWDHLGCMGHPFLKTPHIDRLAAEGALFQNAFVTSSLCSPSRASYLSGLYAHTHGVIDNFTDYPTRFTSYPLRLKEEGYESAYIGKWHMGEEDDRKRPGFDHWISHRGQGKYFDNEWLVNGKREVIKGYYTTTVTDLAVDWMKGRGGEKPFSLIVGHKAPHTPFTPEEKYAKVFDGIDIGYPESAFHLEGKPDWVKQRIDTWHGIYGPLYGFREKFPDTSPASVKDFARFVRAYTATLLSVDESVGRICETLKAMGQLEDTIIVFAGDNGMFLGEHGMTDKRTMHEESIRVPMVVRYPKAIPAGTRVSQQVLNIDLAPSLLDLCNAKPLQAIHGRSWCRLLDGSRGDWRKSWFYEYNYEKQFPYTPNVRGVRTDRWKYIHYPHGDGSPDRHKAELYDLQNDPNELRNQIDDPAQKKTLESLAKELRRLMKETGALPDHMPIDEGVKKELPADSIR
jgi:N-acetylglucosamine-6-sulfatase